MKQKLDDMKRQLSSMEEERYDDVNNRFGLDEFLTPSISPKVQELINQTSSPYVYKKQEEALKQVGVDWWCDVWWLFSIQLMEGLPNKNNVVINQVEYASDKGSALDNMKRFHKNRKRPKSVNNIAIPAVYTLKLPLSMPDQSQETNIIESNDVSNMYGAVPNLYAGMTNDVYINQMGTSNAMVCSNNNNHVNHMIILVLFIDYCFNAGFYLWSVTISFIITFKA